MLPFLAFHLVVRTAPKVGSTHKSAIRKKKDDWTESWQICDTVAVLDQRTVIIRRDDLTSPDVAGLLEEHLRDMRAVSPPESVHALDLAGLRRPGITFWAAWDGPKILGCCALKQLSPTAGELKSMRVRSAVRRQGVGAMLVQHVIDEAKRRGYTSLSLETGAMSFFRPAHTLYRRFGFQGCGPFGAYRDDPNSLFMTLSL